LLAQLIFQPINDDDDDSSSILPFLITDMNQLVNIKVGECDEEIIQQALEGMDPTLLQEFGLG